jgi:calcineurin-like phosphoesterase family protein
MIYFTSDLHFCHDREFLYKPRGFSTVREMNKQIILNWNNTIKTDDEIWVLGDLMLNDDIKAKHCIEQLNGTIHVILGNHDTDNRIKLYKEIYNIASIQYASRMRLNGLNFYLSHYPSMTTYVESKPLKSAIISLHGHTHSDQRFEFKDWYTYNVALEAHNCTPISIKEIINDLKLNYN